MPFGFRKGGGGGRERRRQGGFGGGRGQGRRGVDSMRGGRRVARPESCICPDCATIIAHQSGVPCFQTICPNCGSPLTRQCTDPGAFMPAEQINATQKPVVIQDDCTGCKKCVPVCPEGAIEMKNDKAFIKTELCTRCRLCIPACPFSAIK